MWTLLRRRYEHLRQAGVVVFGLDALDANVPPLGSRAYLAPKAAPQDKPASEPAGKPATEAPKPTGAAPTP